MPCLNEAETVGICVRKAVEAIRRAGIRGEVIVADNGSTDGSIELATAEGARVVPVSAKGYGNALMGGIEAARSEYILTADTDDSHDLSQVAEFVEPLRAGADLVMGNRFRGKIKDGTMKFLHRYVGNPVLSGIGRLLFKAPCGDFHCGYRAFRKDCYERMDIRSTGMEFASEIVVKSTLLKMRIVEIPTTQMPDGRSRPPHLRTWSDGWRHLRFLLMYSPRWLFLYPGAVLIALGASAAVWLMVAERTLFGVHFDVHTLVYAYFAILIGCQLIAFAFFAKIFAISEGLLPEDERLNTAFRYVTLETGLMTGAVIFLLGFSGSIYAVAAWAHTGFGDLNSSHSLRIVIPSAFGLMLGIQIICQSFFLSILGLRRRGMPVSANELQN